MSNLQISKEQKDLIEQYLSIIVDDIFDPRVDLAFKKIFTSSRDESRIALMDFLNTMLELEDSEQIEELTIKNPVTTVDGIHEKQSVMDVWVKTMSGEEIIVEMQMENSDNFIKRSEYIISKLYCSQDLRGKYYDELSNVAVIGILNFTMFKEYPDKFNYCFRYTEKDDKFELSDHLEIRFIELTKLVKLLEKPVEELTKKEMWALFFRYAADSSKKELIKTIIQKEEGIQMASKVLNEISKDEAERVAYIEHLIWTTDQESKLFYAEKKGKLETAKNMLVEGLYLNLISKYTRLSIKEIKKL